MLEWIPSTTPGAAPYAVRLVTATTDEAVAARVSSDALPATFTEAGIDEGDMTPWQRNLVRHSPENFARPDSSQSLASMAALTDGGDGELSTDEDAPGLDLDAHDDAAAADAAAADALATPSAPPPPPLMMSPLRTVPSDEWGHFRSMSSADHLSDGIARTPTAGTTPDYVVEEPLESQALWHATAGTRPPQPQHEREFYEELYAKQLEQSAASLSIRSESPRPPGSENVRWRVVNRCA